MGRVRDYQEGYDIRDLVSKISTPESSVIEIGPPIAGVNYRLKPIDIDLNQSPYCKNARITRNYIEPRPGTTLIASGFDSTMVYIREFTTSAGVTYLIVLTLKSLYYSINLTTFTRLPWYYSTGTVTATAASKIVTGNGTLWLANCRAGDRFKCDADSSWKVIASVDSNIQITLTEDYGSLRMISAYKIDRYFGGTTSNAFWGLTIADVDYFVFSQGIDPVLYVDTNMLQVQRLSSDCPAATCGILYADRLIIGGLTNLAYRIQWCIRGGYTNWIGAGSGFKDWTEDPQAVTGFSVAQGILIVYKSYSISHMAQTGDLSSPFSYDTKVPGVGLFYPGIFFGIGDMDVIGGSDNFYTYDAINVGAVGDDIKDKFLTLIDPSYADLAHSLVVEEFTEAEVFFPTAGNTSPNKCWVYNYGMDIFSGEWDLAADASGYATQIVSEAWNAAVGTWDDDPDIWDSVQILANVPLNMISKGTSLYKLDPNALTDAGVNFTFEWWTKEIKLSGKKTISVYRVWIWYYCAVASTLKCSLSKDGGRTFGAEVSLALTYNEPTRLNMGFFDLIDTSNTALFRFRCTDGGRFQIMKVGIESIESGEIGG